MTPTFFVSSQDPDTIDFPFIFLTTVAEAPGLVLAALLMDRLGRKRTQGILLLATGAAVLVLGVRDSVPMPVAAVLMGIARLLIMAAFSVTYGYTPEAFPTSVRALATGACSACSRIAGIATPYLASAVVSLWVPLGIYAGTAVIAGAAAFALPLETAGVALRDSVAEYGKDEDSDDPTVDAETVSLLSKSPTINS
jgi:MFS family permease